MFHSCPISLKCKSPDLSVFLSTFYQSLISSNPYILPQPPLACACHPTPSDQTTHIFQYIMQTF